MELHRAALGIDRCIALNRRGKGLLRGAPDALIGAVDALLGGHIVLIRKIARKISRLEIQSIGIIVGLDGLHEIVRHFG